MYSILILLVLISIVIIINLLSRNNAIENLGVIDDVNPYISKQPLSPTEVIFYNHLVEALPEFIVLAQVQLASFIKVDHSQIARQETYKWQNPISQQSVDYLICSKDFSIVAAIELDDKSHLNPKVIERDNKKNKNIAAAKIPLIRWHAEDMPKPEVIKRVILSLPTIPKDNTIKVETDLEDQWIAQDQEAFFKRSENKRESSPLNIVVAMVFILGSGWVLTKTLNPFKSVAPTNTQAITQPAPLSVTKPTLSETLKQQKIEQQTNDKLIRQNQTARDQLLKEKEQQERTARADKEKAWKQYYKKSPQCEALNDVVACGNEYITSRNKFENYWEKNKPN